VAPSTYYATKNRRASARTRRDGELGPALRQLWEDNYRVYGARKLWKAAQRAGHDVGRDQVARLMRLEGIEGVRRTKRVRTTRPEPGAPRHPDLVGRDFTATQPNQLWVTDLTYVATWAGVAYVCFIVDACSRSIVGWRVASHMRTSMVLDAIEMARWSRGTRLEGLRCHSDAGQFTSLRYGERLAEIGAVPSIGTVGDSYDNALAETVNGYYKAELVRGPARPGPWKTVEDLELATLGWSTGTTTNASTATSATGHQQSSSRRSTLPKEATSPWSRSNSPSLHQTQGGSQAPRQPSPTRSRATSAPSVLVDCPKQSRHDEDEHQRHCSAGKTGPCN
jgi:putative transposase